MKTKSKFIFPRSISRYWNDQNPFSTHLLNSFTLLFPIGERFFIKSLQNVMPQIDNEALKQEMRWFIQQEADHAKEHERFFQNLNEQGYNITAILLATKFIETIISQNCSNEFKLSLTSAFEHLTALLAQLALEKDFFSAAESPMRELFEWHAFEEMEHRHVAFNVLKEINSSESLKRTGMVTAFIIMLTLSSSFTTYFLAKDKKVLNREVWDEIINIFLLKEKLLQEGLLFLAEYFDRDFHPLNNKKADEILTHMLGQLRAA